MIANTKDEDVLIRPVMKHAFSCVTRDPMRPVALLTLLWHPCSPSLGNAVHVRAEYAVYERWEVAVAFW
jgi:hypothetical protein